MGKQASLVLVHGGFLGPWLWLDVQEQLEQHGIVSTAVDLPSMQRAGAGLDEDVAAVREAAARNGPLVLCGHSYAGMVITEAGVDPALNVAHLVYLAAAVPDTGQAMQDLVPADAGDGNGGGEDVTIEADGRARLTEASARQSLFHDCSPERASAAIERLRPSSPIVATQAVRHAACRQVASTYIEATDDRLPRLVSEAYEASEPHVVSLPTGHCRQWSRPDLVADALIDVAHRVP
jgi:pimeloyl-ACP methyl ester carboxylesterase